MIPLCLVPYAITNLSLHKLKVHLASTRFNKFDLFEHVFILELACTADISGRCERK